MGQQLDSVLSSKAVPTSKDRGRDVLAFDFAKLGWHKGVEAADCVPPGVGTTKKVDDGQVRKILLKHDHFVFNQRKNNTRVLGFLQLCLDPGLELLHVLMLHPSVIAQGVLCDRHAETANGKTRGRSGRSVPAATGPKMATFPEGP